MADGVGAGGLVPKTTEESTILVGVQGSSDVTVFKNATSHTAAFRLLRQQRHSVAPDRFAALFAEAWSSVVQVVGGTNVHTYTSDPYRIASIMPLRLMSFD